MEGTPLAGATIEVLGTDSGTMSDEEGRFCLPPLADSVRVRVSYLGFAPVTTLLSKVTDSLRVELPPLSTDVVVVTGSPNPIRLAESPMKVEIIEGKQLQKSGSSTLMEALFNTNGVTEGINCGVCATNDLHINGLDGTATLFMIDGMPIVGSLASVYGFNSMPVSLVERVEIIKGPASTLYGTEAIGGVINVITRDPRRTATLLASAWTNTHSEHNLDVVLNPKVGPKNYLMLAGNGYRSSMRLEHNGDNFTDLPLIDRVGLYGKWMAKRDLPATISTRYYYEDRNAGVLQWSERQRGSDSLYGESIFTRRFELLGRYAISKMWTLEGSYAGHHQDSYYGATHYVATQHVGYLNLMHHRKLGKHSLTTGIAGRYQWYDDNTPATAEPDSRPIPGLYAEDLWKINSHWSLQGGLRLDYQKEHGIVPAPRLNIKWQPTPLSTFRLNSGTGFRLVNVFTEDHAALTGSRQLVFASDLKPEQSRSLNLNYDTFIKQGKGMINLTFDAFHTWYLNRLIPDYSQEDLIIYNSINNLSITRGLAANLNWAPLPSLSLNLGTTWLDTYQQEPTDQGMITKPILFAPRYTVNWTLTWKHTKWGTQLDWQGKVFGQMQLPEYAEPFTRPTQSPTFSQQSLQLDQRLRKGLSIFVGCRNLLNWTQPSPLIAPDAPFGPDFDTTYAYGPIQSRRFFVGMKLELK